ncbi:hypothetical protein SBV1_660013 [Verrucomicrobia bacterium]|nr:hypothetical protein SBV1_660013 [Verrucomicrobiota bacterium]
MARALVRKEWIWKCAVPRWADRVICRVAWACATASVGAGSGIRTAVERHESAEQFNLFHARPNHVWKLDISGLRVFFGFVPCSGATLASQTGKNRH